jgi:hypothetical protein
MDFIDDDELSGLCTQESVGILKTTPVDRPLEIEVDRAGLPARDNLARQCRLTYLAWAKENDSRHLAEALFHYWPEVAGNHD